MIGETRFSKQTATFLNYWGKNAWNDSCRLFHVEIYCYQSNSLPNFETKTEVFLSRIRQCLFDNKTYQFQFSWQKSILYCMNTFCMKKKWILFTSLMKMGCGSDLLKVKFSEIKNGVEKRLKIHCFHLSLSKCHLIRGKKEMEIVSSSVYVVFCFIWFDVGSHKRQPFEIKPENVYKETKRRTRLIPKNWRQSMENKRKCG